jgi:hypothetical protein
MSRGRSAVGDGVGILDYGETMARVTGIGGVFFKSKGDRAALAEWYS